MWRRRLRKQSLEFAKDRDLELPGFLQADLTNLIAAVQARHVKSQAKSSADTNPNSHK
jgi:hypothetical protein